MEVKIIRRRKRTSSMPITKKKVGSHNYYKERFPNVAPYDVREVYRRSKWILIAMDRYLEDTKKIHTNFFRFAVAILLKMGKEEMLDKIKSGITLYDFLKMNGDKYDRSSY